MEIRTEDGQTVKEGERVFDFYNGRWGVIVPGSVDAEGWFTLEADTGQRTSLNGERVAVTVPRTNPFYATWNAGFCRHCDAYIIPAVHGTEGHYHVATGNRRCDGAAEGAGIGGRHSTLAEPRVN